MKLDLSQEQMAKLFHRNRSPVYLSNISEFELAKREPSLLVLLNYARAINGTVGSLIDEEVDL
jgi:transcriptional regulator with XRE-family HTH domain